MLLVFMQRLRRTKWVWTLSIAWVFMFALIVCSDICQTVEAKVSAHSCCPSESSDEDQNSSSEACCQEPQFVLNKSIIHGKQSDRAFIDFGAAAYHQVSLLESPQNNFLSNSRESAPRSTADVPLYLSKQVFLI